MTKNVVRFSNASISGGRVFLENKSDWLISHESTRPVLRGTFCCLTQESVSGSASLEWYVGKTASDSVISYPISVLTLMECPTQGRNEARWRPGQEASLTWDCSEANLLYWRKHLWHCWNISALSAIIWCPPSTPPEWFDARGIVPPKGQGFLHVLHNNYSSTQYRLINQLTFRFFDSFQQVLESFHNIKAKLSVAKGMWQRKTCKRKSFPLPCQSWCTDLLQKSIHLNVPHAAVTMTDRLHINSQP